MFSVFPCYVPHIDRLAREKMGLDEETLIRRAGKAVAEEIAVRARPSRVLVFCGGGNNGADGYAAALSLADMGFCPKAVDVLDAGQRSEGGKAVLAEYTSRYGAPLSLEEGLQEEAEVCVDAVFGSGARYEALPDAAMRVMEYINATTALRVAVDVPLGADAAYGRLAPSYARAELTVMLSFAKTGLLSYPAREVCGELVTRSLGIDRPEILSQLSVNPIADDQYVKNSLPKREKNTHKGSFGRVAMVAGSAKYRGAALLAAEGAMRLGAGLVSLYTEEAVLSFVGRKRPELLFEAWPSSEAWTEEEVSLFAARLDTASAVLVGPGCDRTQGVSSLVARLLESEGPPLVLDADALNLLSSREDRGKKLLRGARRPVCLTPHPTEMARLVGKTTASVQEARISIAMEYAREMGVCLLLKGASTVVTDGECLALNLSGSDALAKGGSGDVLAGAVAALLAGGASPLDALRLGAYLHGRAGERLAETRSSYGVLPSELPLAMAEEIARISGVSFK